MSDSELINVIIEKCIRIVPIQRIRYENHEKYKVVEWFAGYTNKSSSGFLGYDATTDFAIASTFRQAVEKLIKK